MNRLVVWLFAILMCGAHMQSAAAQDANAKPIPLQYFGLHIHRADDGTAWPNVSFGSWRLWDAYAGWAQLEPERDRWDFSKLDHYVAMAKLTNVEILLPLAMTPRWASSRPDEKSAYRPGNAAEPGSIEDWKKYVSTVGQRYKGKINQYEIWNEPSDKSHYTGDINTLVQLACEARQILKNIDPNIVIVSPASNGGARHTEYLDHFLAAGGNKCIDVVGHHFYVFRQPPEAIVPLIREVRAVMKKNGVGQLPLWSTETGWWIANGDGTPDHPMVANGGWRKLSLDTESGDYLLRAFILARAEGVERFYWYSWDNRYGLGMIEPTTGKPKPMVEKWRSMVDRLLGATQLKCSQSGNAYKCSFMKKNGTADQISWVVE